MIELAIAAGAAAGLASIPHCAGMCGPVAAYASSRGTGPKASLGYHAGRLASYAALGVIAGAGGGVIGDALPSRWAGALLSWSLAVALGLTAWRLLRSADVADRGSPSPTVPLRTKRSRRRSISDRLLAILPKHPLALGLVTALLPCGALYAAVLIAAGSGSAWAGAASMAAFASVSALGLVLVGAVASRVRTWIARGADAPFWSRALGTALLVGALLLIVRPIGALTAPQAPPSCHDASSTGASSVEVRGSGG